MHIAITGASSGIGRELALAFDEPGNQLSLVARRKPLLEELEGQVTAPTQAIDADLADARDPTGWIDRAEKAFGPIDVLVNNAGIIRPAMLDRMTPAQWDEVVGVHLTGSFHCLQAVVPGMIERRSGRIVNVTSAAGLLGTIGQINYSAAKAGVVGLTMSAAKELGRYGITVNAVAPGAATAMTETIRTDERFRESYLARIPLGRWAEPEEIAPVFVFFASEAARYVTGQVLAADGGMTIR